MQTPSTLLFFQASVKETDLLSQEKKTHQARLRTHTQTRDSQPWSSRSSNNKAQHIGQARKIGHAQPGLVKSHTLRLLCQSEYFSVALCALAVANSDWLTESVSPRSAHATSPLGLCTQATADHSQQPYARMPAQQDWHHMMTKWFASLPPLLPAWNAGLP